MGAAFNNQFRAFDRRATPDVGDALFGDEHVDVVFGVINVERMGTTRETLVL